MKRESLDQLGLGALGEDILLKGVIDILVMDNLMKTPVIIYRGCTAASLNESFEVGQIAMEECQFYYLTAARD